MTLQDYLKDLGMGVEDKEQITDAVLALERRYASNKDPETRTKSITAFVQNTFQKLNSEEVVETVNRLINYLGPTNSERRFVGIDFEIANTDLTHNHDLVALQEFAHETLTKYYDSLRNDECEERYLAPYFCFIQSSGMGKTKLLYEMKEAAKLFEKDTTVSWKPTVKLVLCRPFNEGSNEKEVFDDFLTLPKTKGSTFAQLYDKMSEVLDGIISEDAENTPRDVVLLFDEAHYLMDNHNTMEGFWFRVIRLWLRYKRSSCRIVAAFCGTKSEITNFRFDDDVQEFAKTDTREHARNPKKSFYPAGKKLFDVFYTTTTIGCLRGKIKFKPANEYEKSVPFGRPLFAAMIAKGKFRQASPVDNILKRMLLLDPGQDGTQWSAESKCCFNILATRIQMGQTSVDTASDLVGSAYANLVGVEETRMRLCYPPDPVCARLAMCLMDEKWTFKTEDGRTINGMSKSDWAKKIGILFSNRFFTVEKGDFGEVLVAFYFLLSADEVRQESKDDYVTFSVALHSWVDSLYSPSYCGPTATSMEVDVDPEIQRGKRHFVDMSDGDEYMDTSAESSFAAENATNPPQKEATAAIFFNAIQVCRNYMRGYGMNWSSLCDQKFLKNIYEAAVGFHVYAGCPKIDSVFSLMKKCPDVEDVFLPMFVSVKSRDDFTENEAKIECESMLEKAKNAEPQFGALCLLVVFGADDAHRNDDDYCLQNNGWMARLLDKECVAKVLRIPSNDRFGLSNVFASMTSVKEEQAEILTSHCFVGYDDNKLTRSISSSTPGTPRAYASAALRKGRRKQETDAPLETLSQLASQLDFEPKSTCGGGSNTSGTLSWKSQTRNLGATGMLCRQPVVRDASNADSQSFRKKTELRANILKG